VLKSHLHGRFGDRKKKIWLPYLASHRTNKSTNWVIKEQTLNYRGTTKPCRAYVLDSSELVSLKFGLRKVLLTKTSSDQIEATHVFQEYFYKRNKAGHTINYGARDLTGSCWFWFLNGKAKCCQFRQDKFWTFRRTKFCQKLSWAMR